MFAKVLTTRSTIVVQMDFDPWRSGWRRKAKKSEKDTKLVNSGRPAGVSVSPGSRFAHFSHTFHAYTTRGRMSDLAVAFWMDATRTRGSLFLFLQPCTQNFVSYLTHGASGPDTRWPGN